MDLKTIVDLSKKRWFVYAGSEIYGGLANAWDYGPYGSLMKENIKNLWIKEFVQKKPDMMLQDAAILMNPKVWVASGHVGWFSDPLMDCKSCNSRQRADKLIEEDYAKKWIDDVADGMTNAEMEAYISDNNIACPECGKHDWTEIRQFNLMFKTSQWVTDDSSNVVYLRPETAQGIFVNFANIIRSSRRKLPLWVAQIWKAFRNEITPGNFIFRTREFEQMEIEYFCSPAEAPAKYLEWKESCMNFIQNTVWIKDENVRFREHGEDELAHYADWCFDIEYKFPMGWGELRWVANRTDFDLKAHMTESKQDLSYFDPVNNTKYVPYVIEPSVWLTRLFLAILCDSYTEEEDRVYLKLDPKVAPIKVWILPIVKKLSKEAREIFDVVSENFTCEYDDAGSIGKRYSRFDEIWTPFCIAIDSENFDSWNVTIRHRDSMEQEVVAISELTEFLRKRLS